MIGRRQLLSLLGAGAAAPGVQAVASLAGPLAALPAEDEAEALMGSRVGSEVVSDDNEESRERNRLHRLKWRLGENLRAKHYADRDVSEGKMPVFISTKRSWSPAFKAHLNQKHQAEVDELERAIEDADLYAVARLMGWI